VGKTHPSVIELSAFLNKAEFHAAEKRSSTFRNPNGIHLKLRDLEAGRPGYAGKWLSSSRMDRAIWAEYGNKLDEVSKDAKQIRAHFH
jgi:5-methylcytosine-specific restriction protein A